jgi:inosose dehydratase
MADTAANQAITVANAPCSFGAFELTVGINPNVPDAIALLDQVAGTGYAGIDLGPPGYLGRGTELHERLSSRGLALAGGYLELPYTDHDALREAIDGELNELLTIFDSVGDLEPRPKPTLADPGSDLRRANPGRSNRDPSFGWSDADWRLFADGFARVYDYCLSRGYEPTFHNETGSYVEAPWEIEKVLELTDVGFCLDTGHLLIAGGDPVAAVNDWGTRINHLHVKDARQSVLDAITADHGNTDEIWRRRAFSALGEGDIALDALFDAVRSSGYSGWLVVEQDIFPEATDPPGSAAEQQLISREFLRARGI